jgi:hypothetical protein
MFFLFEFKVLATCGIRKLLDYVFTQRELFWLDDILPGSKLNDKENKNKNDAHLNDKVDSSEDNFFKNNAKNFSRKSSVSITFIFILILVFKTRISFNFRFFPS